MEPRANHCKIEIITNEITGEQDVFIDGMPYSLVSDADKLLAVGRASKAQCGIADFVQRTLREIISPQTVTVMGNA